MQVICRCGVGRIVARTHQSHRHCSALFAYPSAAVSGQQFRAGRELSTGSDSLAATEYFATCHPGLEPALALELENENITAEDIQVGYSGVSFRGKGWETGFQANLWLRSALRVLVKQASQPLYTNSPDIGAELYDFFRGAATWRALLRPGQTFSVEGRVAGRSDVTEQFLRLRSRDAICDAIRSTRGDKPVPPAPGEQADLPLFVHLQSDTITLYRDMSGQSLHNRGYRSVIHRAGLNACAAAGILTMAGWPELSNRPGVALADPMCGSGTFLIEAALMATNAAPGLSRPRWPFQSWPEFDRRQWADCESAALSARRDWKGQLLGNDVHAGSLSLAQRSAEVARVGRLITLNQDKCQEWRPMHRPDIVVCNPPWGMRLLDAAAPRSRVAAASVVNAVPRRSQHGDRRIKHISNSRVPDDMQPQGNAEELEATWKDLSAFLKGRCPNADAFLLSGNADVTRHLHMRATKGVKVSVGGIECRLLHYHILPPKQAGQSEKHPY